MPEYFIGLMSGTSMDALDAVLADFASGPPVILASASCPIEAALRESLRALSQPGFDEITRLAWADHAIVELSVGAVRDLLDQAGVASNAVRAIGSHGQTVRHCPSGDPPFTLQIGDPQRIAEATGITVVGDFRRRDMAAGGQGAPLVPAFHAALFRTPVETRAILNLGGIANLTLLPADAAQPVRGFDTGPANTLLDAWSLARRGVSFDDGGVWAARGGVHEPLLAALLADDYFMRAPPKSTGPEQFNLDWLRARAAPAGIDLDALDPADVQATLAALTATSIARALCTEAPDTQRLIVCGGGARNTDLLHRLRSALPGLAVGDSAAYGIPPGLVEPLAFAWLARETLAGRPGNLPEVTGARRAVVLGVIAPA